MNLHDYTLDKDPVQASLQMDYLAKRGKVIRFNQVIYDHEWFGGYSKEHLRFCCELAISKNITPIVPLNIIAGLEKVNTTQFNDTLESEVKFRTNKQEVTEADRLNFGQDAMIATSTKIFTDQKHLEFALLYVQGMRKFLPAGTVLDLNPDIWARASERPYLTKISPVAFETVYERIKSAWEGVILPPPSFLYDWADGRAPQWTHPPTGYAGYVCEYGVKWNHKDRAGAFKNLHKLMRQLGTYLAIPHEATDARFFELWRTPLGTKPLWNAASYKSLLAKRKLEPGDFTIIPLGFSDKV